MVGLPPTATSGPASACGDWHRSGDEDRAYQGTSVEARLRPLISASTLRAAQYCSTSSMVHD